MHIAYSIYIVHELIEQKTKEHIASGSTPLSVCVHGGVVIDKTSRWIGLLMIYLQHMAISNMRFGMSHFTGGRRLVQVQVQGERQAAPHGPVYSRLGG